jgi:hypothetical protein
MIKGHNWGLCGTCGKTHGEHVPGMLGKRYSTSAKRFMSLNRGGDGTGKATIICKNCGIVKEVRFTNRGDGKHPHKFCSKGCATSWRNKNYPEVTHNKEASKKRWKKLRDNPGFIANNLKSMANARNHIIHKEKQRAWTKSKKPSQEEMNRIYGKKGVLNNMYGVVNHTNKWR